MIEVGHGKNTSVNCLIGFNSLSDCEYEMKKVNKIMQMEEKPNIISDLSTKRIQRNNTIWYRVVKETPFVSATLPIYLTENKDNLIDANELLDIIIEQMEYGVGLITIHPTANRQMFEAARKRMVPITSRGGGLVIKDLIKKDFTDENVYLKVLPQIISHAQKHHVALSLGTTFRSGNIFDCNDEAQRMEIETQIKLAKFISQQNVGVIIESPGHARPSDIVKISSILRDAGFPVMPLGPIPTDTAIGMDHISGAIGATIMGLEGCANIISAVTREEHTGGRPTIESTIEAIRTARIAAHIIDIHNINDTTMDMIVAEERGKTNTCIVGKGTKYCDRCKELCPLSIR
ncbi:phosphomethylpyrimidine synthase ThiC [Clostridium tagluense]|nr:phosphomethylpyrimidine synthase ThiC [Clostridium tagluense]